MRQVPTTTRAVSRLRPDDNARFTLVSLGCRVATRESTRTKLLDAADELLFSHGVAGTPVDVILERAGVSPATLYRAYGSKDGLVAAALDRRHREWLEVWDEAVARAPDDRARLLAVFDALDVFQARPTGAPFDLRLELAAVCRYQIAVRGYVRSGHAALAQLVEHVIRNDGVRCSSHLSGTILP